MRKWYVYVIKRRLREINSQIYNNTFMYQSSLLFLSTLMFCRLRYFGV